MTDCKEHFAKLDLQVCGTVKFGDSSINKIEGCGTIILKCKTGEHRVLTGVYFILCLRASIVSLGQLDETGCRININGGVLRIFDQSNQLLARVLHSASCLYFLELQVGHPVCLATRSTEAAWRWHVRFGHLNFESLHKLAAQKMVRGLLLLDQVDEVCDGCLVEKQRRASFPAQARRWANSVLELVHGDLCGPIAPATPSGNRYFLLLIDDLSRYMWLRLLSSKDQAPAEIKNFQAIIEAETGKKLKVLRTDQGGVHVGRVQPVLR
jgi:hypothetical protein